MWGGRGKEMEEKVKLWEEGHEKREKMRTKGTCMRMGMVEAAEITE